jgi:hypothetical protein
MTIVFIEATGMFLALKPEMSREFEQPDHFATATGTSQLNR